PEDPEQGQDDAGNVGQGVDEVEVGEQQVPPDEQGGHAPLEQQSPVQLERLNQAPRPALTLVDELAPGVRGIGEQAGVFSKTDAVPLLEHLPCHHDVFAHGGRPASDLAQGGGVVDREGALGHQGALVEALQAFDGGNAVEVVPLLDFGDEVLAG